MLELKLAANYARALLLAAKENGRLEEVEKSLEFINQVAESDPLLKSALEEPWDSVVEKEEALVDALKGRVDDLVLGLLLALARRRREELFPLILEKFRELAARERGEVLVEVHSPFALSPSQKRILEEALTESLGKGVRLEEKIDPSLIGGVSVRVGERVFDFSLARLLELMRRRLLRTVEAR